MAGRITNSMLSSDYLRNTRRNLSNMRTMQNQLSSGKEIQKASDDPYKASRSMQLHTEMSYNTQYNENIKDTSNWLDTTDTALSQMGNVFGRIETLLVSAGNGAYDTDERLAVQDEIKEKVNELSQILNTSFDGSYIFGGTKTDSKPTTVVNGVLQYADGAGNGIGNTSSSVSVYTKVVAGTTTITDSATVANTAYTLTPGDIITLTTEAANLATSPARVAECNALISDGAGSSQYKKAADATTITSSPTTANTPHALTTADITALKTELTSAVEPRKTEISNMLAKVPQMNQINSRLEVDISLGVKSVYNKTAIDVLEFTDKSGNSINVSDLLKNIISDLGTTGNKDNITTTDLKDIQSVTANLLQQRSGVGSMQNRMESAQTNNETQNYNMTDILSKTEDIDITEKTMDYAMLQTVYTASLQTSAKILPMTILSYL